MTDQKTLAHDNGVDRLRPNIFDRDYWTLRSCHPLLEIITADATKLSQGASATSGAHPLMKVIFA